VGVSQLATMASSKEGRVRLRIEVIRHDLRHGHAQSPCLVRYPATEIGARSDELVYPFPIPIAGCPPA